MLTQKGKELLNILNIIEEKRLKCEHERLIAEVDRIVYERFEALKKELAAAKDLNRMFPLVELKSNKIDDRGKLVIKVFSLMIGVDISVICEVDSYEYRIWFNLEKLMKLLKEET